MTTLAKDTFGAVLRLADSGGSPALIAELTNVQLPGVTRAALDATTHDSTDGAMEYIGDGVYGVGEISIEGNLIGGSTADVLLHTALTTNTPQDFEGDFKAASGTRRMSGTAIVTAYTPGPMPVAGALQTFSATLQVTGPLTFATV